MTNLEMLDLAETYVTQAGVDQLKKALPQCSIRWTPAIGIKPNELSERTFPSTAPAHHWQANPHGGNQ